ncbi:MAG: hypothetical protein RL481_2212, partial [Pseudomonadota bacterium]
MIEAIPNIAAIAPAAPKPAALDMAPIDTTRVSFQQLLSAGVDATNMK